MDKDLFSITLSRIIRVINCNYFKDFFQQELAALNQCHSESVSLSFNANGDSLPGTEETGRQANIFKYMGKGQRRPNDLSKSAMVTRSQANSEISVKRIKKVQDIINKEKVPEESKDNGTTGESPVME